MSAHDARTGALEPNTRPCSLLAKRRQVGQLVDKVLVAALLVVDQPALAADGREALVRIIGPEHQPVLRSARQHAVRLAEVLRAQIVDVTAQEMEEVNL